MEKSPGILRSDVRSQKSEVRSLISDLRPLLFFLLVLCPLTAVLCPLISALAGVESVAVNSTSRDILNLGIIRFGNNQFDITGSARGDILYKGASGWTRLGAGATGQFLKTQGAAADPTWATAGVSFVADAPLLLSSGHLSIDLSAYVPTSRTVAGKALSSNITLASTDLTDTSSITLQGNTFNAASKLVQLTAANKYPALDGSLITNLPSGFDGLFTSLDFTGGNITSIPLRSYNDLQDLPNPVLESQVVHVDPTYGDNATGTIGDPSKPFLTVQAALTAIENVPSNGFGYLINVGANQVLNEDVTTSLQFISFKGTGADNANTFHSLTFTGEVGYIQGFTCLLGDIIADSTAQFQVIMENAFCGDVTNTAGGIEIAADLGFSQVGNVTGLTAAGPVNAYNLSAIYGTVSAPGFNIHIENCVFADPNDDYSNAASIDSAGSEVWATFSILKEVLVSGTLHLKDARVAGTNNATSTIYDDVLLAGDDTAYNATTWDANLRTPSKNAIRDKFESLIFPANTTATSNQWFTAYNSTTGVFTKAQPAFTDLSGSAVIGQLPTGTTSSTVALGDKGVTTLSLATPNVIFSTPVTFSNTSGAWTGTLSLNNQSANTFFGNGTGSSATPTFMSASTARTALGATTVGSNLFTATNPSAITFPKVAADNSVSFRTPAQVLSDIGAQAAGSYAASGANTDITSVLLNQTGLVIKGGDANALTIKPNETLTAGRILNLKVNDAARTIDLSGNLTVSAAATVSGTNTGDQTLSDATISTTNITTNDATTSKHGFLQKLPGGTTTFLRADGSFAAPAGAGTVTNTGGNLTANAVVLGAGGADTKVVTGIVTDGTAQLTTGSHVINGTAGAGVVLMQSQSSAPSTPGSGLMDIYAKTVSGREFPRFVGATGIDQALQTALWSGQISAWFSGGTAAGTIIGQQFQVLGTNTQPTVATTNFYTLASRNALASVVTTTNQTVGLFETNATFLRGASAGQGGFFFFCRFGSEKWVAGDRLFVGLTNQAAASVMATDTSGQAARYVGFCIDAGDTAITFLTNQNGTSTKAAIASQPTLATNQGYDAYIFAKPNDTTVYYRLDNLLTGAVIVDTSTSTNLPTNTVFMRAIADISNAANTTVTDAQIGVNKLYVETNL